MLLPCEDHRLLLVEDVLVPGTIEVAVVGRASPGDEYLSGWEGAGRGIVLYFAIVDGGETIAVGDGAESEDLLPFAKETNLGVDLVTDLNERLIPCKRHHQHRELDHGWSFMLLYVQLFNGELLFGFLVLVDLLQ